MTTQSLVEERQEVSPKSTKPGWWLVAAYELRDLWVGGRAVVLLLLFSILLGILSFLLASNAELKLLPPREMAFMVVQITIVVGLFLGMLISADAISGERERATLEGLLLVPTSRRQIVVGKYLAAISPWPAALALAALHLLVLTPNNTIFMQAFLLAAVLGTLLVLGFTSFGMLMSLWSTSNRTSLFVTMLAAVLFSLPTQFPGTAQTGFMGRAVKRINPIESVNQIIEKVLVNNRGLDEMSSWLASPIIFALLLCALLFIYAAPRLDMDGEKPRFWKSRGPRNTKMISLFFAAPLIVALVAPANHVYAQTTADPERNLHIELDKDVMNAKTGDTLDFTSTVTYTGPGESGEIVVAMNIINLGDGDPVDPEDWSPERTQTLEPLASGESATLDWTINTILQGDYLAYMVVVAAPDSANETTLPVASKGIHMTVGQFSPLNPGGVLPLSVGMPMVIGVLLWVQTRMRRNKLAKGGATAAAPA